MKGQTMRVLAISILLAILGGCGALGDAVDYPPEATPQQAATQPALDAGDPLPEDQSNHPIDQAERSIERIDNAAGSALNPLTSGWWGVIAPAALGALNVFQGTMRRAEKRKAKGIAKKARRALEDAGHLNEARKIEDDSEE
jgi:hypothetical protein